jgi:hypothetical protein
MPTYFTGFRASKLDSGRAYDVKFWYEFCVPTDLGIIQSSKGKALSLQAWTGLQGG